MQQEERLINIEMALAEQERVIEELNEVIIAQGKQLDLMEKQIRYLADNNRESSVKPLSEETPPPHY